MSAKITHVEARSTHSLDMPVGDGSGERVSDIIGEVDPALELVEQLGDVLAALRQLPERDREILLHTLIAGLCQKTQPCLEPGDPSRRATTALSIRSAGSVAASKVARWCPRMWLPSRAGILPTPLVLNMAR